MHHAGPRMFRRMGCRTPPGEDLSELRSHRGLHLGARRVLKRKASATGGFLDKMMES
jgi:hypothetical protein